MKKSIQIVSIVVVIALFLGILFFINSFLGNPISRSLVNKSAEKYVEEQYGHLDLVREDAGYNLKNGNYFVILYSETIEDLHFSLYYSQLGNLQRDLYENNIDDGWNVMTRISEEYRIQAELVLETLKNTDIFRNGEHFFGSAWLQSNDFPEIYKDKSFGIDTTKLELDKIYDVGELGKQSGLIDVAVSFADLDTSYERGAAALIEIKETLDKENIGFYYINFAVFNTDGNYAYYIENFHYEDIYTEGLAERIQKTYDENPIS